MTHPPVWCTKVVAAATVAAEAGSVPSLATTSRSSLTTSKRTVGQGPQPGVAVAHVVEREPEAPLARLLEDADRLGAVQPCLLGNLEHHVAGLEAGELELAHHLVHVEAGQGVRVDVEEQQALPRPVPDGGQHCPPRAGVQVGGDAEPRRQLERLLRSVDAAVGREPEQRLVREDHAPPEVPDRLERDADPAVLGNKGGHGI